MPSCPWLFRQSSKMMRCRLALAVLLTGAALLASSACSNHDRTPSTTIVVNSLDDTATPASGVTTLRAAIAKATANDTIAFDPVLNGSTIVLTVIGNEHSTLKGEIYSGMTFQGYGDRDYGKSAIYADGDLTIDASSLPAGITIAWGGGDANPARVLAVNGDLVLENVAITSGFSKAEPVSGGTQPYTLARGGGLAVWGTAHLKHCTIAGNRCLGDNTASRDRGTYGGGIYANCVDIEDSVISGNSAVGYGAAGGGIYSVGGADLQGGIGLESSLNRCSVTGNRVTAKHAYGGGVFTLAGGPNNLSDLRVENCTIARNLVEDNTALPVPSQYYYRGGGIYMGGGSLILLSSTVVENRVDGPLAIFSGKPNRGGGGIAATIGNAHVVENVYVKHSIVAGNELAGTAEDWFAGSLLNFYSLGYNRFGVLDFSQILVPVPDWTDLSRKHYPKVGDQEAVALDQVLAVGEAHFHGSVLSAGTDAGGPAVLWYPPTGSALDQIPTADYGVSAATAGYSGFGVSTDDFLNSVLAKLRTEYASVLGVDFGSGFGDMTGVTWYGPAVTWPANSQNAAWIAFWRNLDTEIGSRLGMVRLGDEFWSSFSNGPLGNVVMTISSQTNIAGLASEDQLRNARPHGSLGDIGAIERQN
jgi:hypothetical protein